MAFDARPRVCHITTNGHSKGASKMCDVERPRLEPILAG